MFHLRLIASVALLCLITQFQIVYGIVPPIWFSQPAEDWEEALPIGNGRIAAMVFGQTEVDRIQFNEETLWSGAPQDSDNPKALEALPRIRKLLFEGDYKEAQRLTYKYLLCKGPGSLRGRGAEGDFGCYQTFGDLYLHFPNQKDVLNYRRELNLDDAIVRVTYSLEDAQYTREYFASGADQVCAIHLSCDKPGRISFSARLSREERAFVKPEGLDALVMEGQLTPPKGVNFIAKLRCIAQNGSVTIEDNALVVNQADSVVLLLAAATDYKQKKHREIVKEQIDSASQKSYVLLRNAHTQDYRSYFQRVKLELDGLDYEMLPTNQRLEAISRGGIDPKLIAQYFHFNRYLLISSSRPGCLPANLQGKWAHQIQTPWNCDYHMNINLQMNYWAAEVANLGDCHKPLFDFISDLRVPGKRTAKVHYNARGWVSHHITNIWGFTSPAEDAKWGLFPSASGWLCRHLWEHFAYSQDLEFLKNAYPIMKESAQFYLDFLIEEPEHGWLITSPSSSPENQFIAPDGGEYSICAGPSMDLQIIWDLFTHTSQAAKILNDDLEFAFELDAARAKLAPPQIGKHGQLQEWFEDFEEAEPGHRHISHLFALYPGHQISEASSPHLTQAARKTLERRLMNGGGHTGWSQAWIINFWARLRESEKAHEHLNALLAVSTFPNLFDSHPFPSPKERVFQIDGNFGAAAGIAEMLLQSHDEEIHLLPALPSAWPKGYYKGLCARGGLEVDVSWENGKILNAQLRSCKSGKFFIRFAPGNSLSSIRPLTDFDTVSDGAIQISMQADTDYMLNFR